MATSQMLKFPKRQLPKSVLTAALSPLASSSRSARLLAHPCRSARPLCGLRHLRRPNPTFGKLPLGIMYISEVVTWEIVTWEVALGKVSNTLNTIIFLPTLIFQSSRYPWIYKIFVEYLTSGDPCNIGEYMYIYSSAINPLWIIFRNSWYFNFIIFSNYQGGLECIKL